MHAEGWEHAAEVTLPRSTTIPGLRQANLYVRLSRWRRRKRDLREQEGLTVTGEGDRSSCTLVEISCGDSGQQFAAGISLVGRSFLVIRGLSAALGYAAL